MERKLLELGFKATKGLLYLAEAIRMKIKDNAIKTCEIYNEIAKKYHMKYCAVERDIRHCITISDYKCKDKNSFVINRLAIELSNLFN